MASNVGMNYFKRISIFFTNTMLRDIQLLSIIITFTFTIQSEAEMLENKTLTTIVTHVVRLNKLLKVMGLDDFLKCCIKVKCMS